LNHEQDRDQDLVQEEHEKVLLAIDKFEEGIRVKPKGDEEPYYCVKYCRECELVCPVGK